MKPALKIFVVLALFLANDFSFHGNYPAVVAEAAATTTAAAGGGHAVVINPAPSTTTIPADGIAVDSAARSKAGDVIVKEVRAKRDVEGLLKEIMSKLNEGYDGEVKDYGSRVDDIIEESRQVFHPRSRQTGDDIFVDRRWRPVNVMESDRAGQSVALTSKQKQAIVDLHNVFRKQEGSSNMETLHYNDKLGDLAQTWCERCVFEHGQPAFDASAIGSKHIGQNIYSTGVSQYTMDDAINAWYAEKFHFDVKKQECKEKDKCTHYTAVVWAETTDVGCGLCSCPSLRDITNAQFVVCNYLPAGNWAGEKPYVRGPACSNCTSGKFFCKDWLCDSKNCTTGAPNCECKAACKQCGKRSNDCTCQCAAGTARPDCSGSCEDFSPKCNKSPGYQSSLCSSTDPDWQFVKRVCPKMCGTCQPSSVKPTCHHRSWYREDLDEMQVRDAIEDYLNEKHDPDLAGGEGYSHD